MRSFLDFHSEMTGLDIFINQVEGEFERSHGDEALETIHEELTSRCMDAWITMEPCLRSYFNREASLPQQSRQSAGERRRSRRQPKDPRAPKRPLTAYFVYCREKRPLVHLERPELKHIELTCELANRWNHLTQEEREPYNIAAQLDRKRYIDEMAQVKLRQDRGIDEDSVSEGHAYDSPEISDDSDSAGDSPESRASA